MKIIIFDDIIDEREALKVIHELQDILFLCLCAVLCGAEDYEAIVEYGKQKKKFLHQFVKLSGGIPSVSTIQRLFRYLDPANLITCLKKNIEEVMQVKEKCLLNIDGKVLRGTTQKGKKKSGICILTAWATEQQLVVGQLKLDEKSNEKIGVLF